MSQINRPPRGLQGLLDSKNFGKNPDQLAQLVSPTIDFGQFLTANLLDVSTAIATNPNEGDIVTVTIPDQENWAVYAVAHFQDQLSTNDIAMCKGFLRLNQGLAGASGFNYVSSVGDDISGSADVEIQIDTFKFDGLIFPAGTEFSFQLLQYQGTIPANYAIRIDVLHARISV